MYYKVGDFAYYIQNGMEVRYGCIISRSGDFYTLVTAGHGEDAGLRLRGSRLFPTEKAATEQLRKIHPEIVEKMEQKRAEERRKKGKFRTPWDYAW